jgi:hypothetical protein
MAFPTGAINDQVYTSKYGTRYKYVSASNKWLQYAAPLYGSIGEQGMTGAPGLTGTQGSIGVAGETGSQGVQGTAGATGGPGTQGATGIAGEASEGAIGIIGYYGAATGVLSFSLNAGDSYLKRYTQVTVKVPYNINLNSWEVVSKETGFFSCDVKACNYSDWPEPYTMNLGGTGPYLNNAIKNSASSMSGWTATNVPSPNYMQAYVGSGTTGVKNITVSLNYSRY